MNCKWLRLTQFFFSIVISASACFADDARPTVSLQSHREVGQIDKVVVVLDFAGDLTERAKPGAKEERTAISGADHLIYFEKTLEAAAGRRRSARYYAAAESVAKFKDGPHSPSLDANRRLVVAALDAPTVKLYSPAQPLTRDELEVIDILGNSLLVDDLLPSIPVAEGDVWELDLKTVAALLGLGDATRSDVQCVLKEVTDDVARVEFAGNVKGTINDAKSRIKIKGKYRFDRRSGRIDWLAMVTREERSRSQVAAGFDIGVKFQMSIAPGTTPELSNEKLAGIDLEPSPKSDCLSYQSPHDRWSITYDRSWYLGSDDRHRALLKRMDQGTLTAQCHISTLADRDPDKAVSLEEFQEDVRRALGDSFGEFVEAKQSVDAANHRVLRVVVHGKAQNKKDEVLIRWVYYHVADRQGHQTALTFTIEQEKLDQFSDADKAIVESFRFDATKKADGE